MPKCSSSGREATRSRRWPRCGWRRPRSSACAAAAGSVPTRNTRRISLGITRAGRSTRFMKKHWLWIGIGGVVVLALVAVNIARSSKGKSEPVQLARVHQENITSVVRAPGKIEPETQVKVSADIPGKIMKLYVKEGDQVRLGQLM